MKNCLLIVVCASAVLFSTDAWLFSTADEPAWDGLRVTFGFLNGFNEIPRTSSSAIKQRFTVSKHCSNANAFKGTRYWKNNDVAAMPLYDRNGYIIGIQSAVTVAKATERGYPSKNIMKWFHKEGGIYTVTMYFVDPATLRCDSGRTDADFKKHGTGTGLWLQMNNNRFLHMPMSVTDVTAPWVEGECFWGMGKHYWYNISLDMACSDFSPFFIMFNKGKLNAFGFAFNADSSSPRFEHPPTSVLRNFLPFVPTCVAKSKGRFTTMHVYLTDSPRWNFC